MPINGIQLFKNFITLKNGFVKIIHIGHVYFQFLQCLSQLVFLCSFSNVQFEYFDLYVAYTFFHIELRINWVTFYTCLYYTTQNEGRTRPSMYLVV
jgi:hypothetical protein